MSVRSDLEAQLDDLVECDGDPSKIASLIAQLEDLPEDELEVLVPETRVEVPTTIAQEANEMTEATGMSFGVGEAESPVAASQGTSFGLKGTAPSFLGSVTVEQVKSCSADGRRRQGPHGHRDPRRDQVRSRAVDSRW